MKELRDLELDVASSYQAFDELYLRKRQDCSHGGHSFLGRGLYALQLELWFQHFPREQFLVLPMELLGEKSKIHVRRT